MINDNSSRSKNKKFCCSYVMLGNVAEAAVRAGFDKENALFEGMSCLKSESCRKLIASLRAALSDSGAVVSGLKRLAFGSCSDAVYLVFAEELPPPQVIEKLDLFNVSEIKRVKGGGVEVKFFDRQKAIERLFEFENAYSDRSNATGLMEALAGNPTPEGEGDALEI